MSDPYWTTTITAIGEDFPDMFEAGVIILFGEPVPPALADVSLVHRAETEPARDLAAGDVIEVGGGAHTLERVGEKAAANLRELGHVVLYVDAADQQLLPGAVHVTGPVTAPGVGDTVTLRSA